MKKTGLSDFCRNSEFIQPNVAGNKCRMILLGIFLRYVLSVHRSSVIVRNFTVESDVVVKFFNVANDLAVEFSVAELAVDRKNSFAKVFFGIASLVCTFSIHLAI